MAAGNQNSWRSSHAVSIALGESIFNTKSSKPDVANLYQMWVAPSYRRLGAGRMLLEAVIAWARAANVLYLELTVTSGNSSATRLYARAGFQPIGEAQLLRPGSELLSQPMRLKLSA